MTTNSQKLILHVGAHKTASSMIQRALQQHTRKLRQRGLAVVHRKSIVESDFAAAMKHWVIKGKAPTADELAAGAASLVSLADRAQPTVLFTNEDLLEVFRRPRFYRHVGAALEWVSSLTDMGVSVLLYTRAQPDYIESLYMQRVHLGDTPKFADVANQYDKLDLSWTRVLSDMSDVVGRDNVQAIPYESIHRVGSSAYYANFLHACGVEDSQVFPLPPEMESSSTANRSYSDEAMRLALTLNPLLDPKDRPELRRFLQENYSTATHPRAKLFSEHERLGLLDRYRSENARLFEQFMPGWVRDGERYGVGRDAQPDQPVTQSAWIPPAVSVPARTSPAPRNKDAVLDVLIPHYEDPEGLQLALDSVAAQSWAGTRRAVVFDDGSVPTTFDQVKCIADGQPYPVTVLRSEENLGRPRARNRLLDAVTAPYVAWLDAGDEWYRDKLRVQFDHLRHLECAGEDLDRIWVSCAYDWDQSGRTRTIQQQADGDQLRDLLAGDTLRAYLWTLLGRTEAFQGAGLFDEQLPRMQDLDYFLHFVAAGGRISVPPTTEPLCRYVKSDAGRQHREIAAAGQLIQQKYAAHFARYGSGFVARGRWKYATLAARYARNNGDKVAAVRYVVSATAANPRYAAYRIKRRVLGD